MYETRVNQNTTNRVSSWTPSVRSGFSPIGLFIGDNIVKRIPLTQDKFALVDNKDYIELLMHKWHAAKRGNTFYASRNSARPNRKAILMHRIIMNAQKGQEVDHQDGDGLNNQRYNLRICTHIQNMQNMRKHKSNSSLYKGVCWAKSRKKWQVNIAVNKKFLFLGRFKSEIEAAKVYDQKAKELFGEFAYLNFPN